MKGQIEFNGHNYKKQKNGYYTRVVQFSLHRDVWRLHNGEIPIGFQIHHKDGNKENNDISNLECVSHSDHVKIHWNEKKEYLTQKVRENIKKASLWRKTKKGKDFYAKHGKSVWKKSPKHFRKCHICEKTFECFKRSNKIYCSRHCRHIFQKNSYVEKRMCEICKNEFETYKYNRTVTCGKDCRLVKFQSTRSLKNGLAHEQLNSQRIR